MTKYTPSPSASDPFTAKGETGHIRLLATTDLHGHLLAHDYVTDRAQPGKGLAGIATLVETARAEAATFGAGTVLLDNGDTLQGTPLAKSLAEQPVTKTNALVACMNALKYDAVGVGNHDLDFGLTYLTQIAEALEMPMICSNLSGLATDAIKTSALIPFTLTTSSAEQVQVKIGVLSLMPPLTKIWNGHILGQSAQIEGTLACLRRLVPQLRANGADLIVVLAHMGVGHGNTQHTEDAGALALAEIKGIDALITGHTHRRLPGLDYQDRPGVDAQAGKLGSMPAVMAGHGGSDLAVMDLKIQRKDGVWQVVDHQSALRPNTAETIQSPAIVALSAKAHAATLQALARPVGRTDLPIHNYFVLVTPSETGRLMAQAKARLVKEALRDTPYKDLPLLASAAAHTSGGRGGPEHYLHIPRGDILLRHIAGFDPFANLVWARLISGRNLLRWLEHSARIFATIRPGQPQQNLIDTTVPSFHFDTIYGVHYQIDPTAPPGHDTGRILNLTWQGQPVTPEQQLIVATNQFRAAGGGGFHATTPEDILMRKPALLTQSLVDEATKAYAPIWTDTRPWQFVSDLGVQATLLTNPAAKAYLDDIAHLHPEILGITAEGFARVQLTL